MRGPDEDLVRRRESLAQARRVHRETLRGRQDVVLETRTRADMLAALEDFITGLKDRRLPIPPGLQREVRILHSLASYPRSRRSRV